MILFRLIMAPSNAVCDWIGLKDENERGVVRQLVNSLLWITIIATGFFVAWMAGVR